MQNFWGPLLPVKYSTSEEQLGRSQMSKASSYHTQFMCAFIVHNIRHFKEHKYCSMQNSIDTFGPTFSFESSVAQLKTKMITSRYYLTGCDHTLVCHVLILRSWTNHSCLLQPTHAQVSEWSGNIYPGRLLGGKVCGYAVCEDSITPSGYLDMHVKSQLERWRWCNYPWGQQSPRQGDDRYRWQTAAAASSSHCPSPWWTVEQRNWLFS